MPGGHDLDLVRAALVEQRVADEAGIERLLRIYGARARRLIELVAESDRPAAGNPLFAAEVALAFREEFAVTLIDVVFRRTMRGLDADQGRPDYSAAASLAQAECGWDDARREHELGSLVAYADSLRRLATPGDQSAPPR
jgi:glycerol-3-phosphate dehydrogenase